MILLHLPVFVEHLLYARRSGSEVAQITWSLPPTKGRKSEDVGKPGGCGACERCTWEGDIKLGQGHDQEWAGCLVLPRGQRDGQHLNWPACCGIASRVEGEWLAGSVPNTRPPSGQTGTPWSLAEGKGTAMCHGSPHGLLEGHGLAHRAEEEPQPRSVDGYVMGAPYVPSCQACAAQEPGLCNLDHSGSPDLLRSGGGGWHLLRRESQKPQGIGENSFPKGKRNTDCYPRSNGEGMLGR